MIKHHNLVLKKTGGGVENFPMKQWLRSNPEHVPEGMHPDTATSHELRRALKNEGWKLKEKDDQILMIKPSDERDTSFADSIPEIPPQAESRVSSVPTSRSSSRVRGSKE